MDARSGDATAVPVRAAPQSAPGGVDGPAVNGAGQRRAAWPGVRDLPRDAWLARVVGHPEGSPYLHPEVVMAAHPEGEPGPIAWSGGGGDDAAPLGLLAPARKVVAPVPGLPLGLTLRGRRLVGNHALAAEDPEALRPFAEALVDLAAGGAADFVLIDELHEGSALDRAVCAAAGRGRRVSFFRPASPQAHWWIRFPATAADYWKKFNSRTRHSIRSRGKKFEHEVVHCRGPEDVPQFIGLARRVSLASWQGKTVGVRVRDDAGEHRRLEALARIGALRSCVLLHRGRPVAFVLGVQWNGRFVYEETAYDLEFRPHSPGIVLLNALVDDLIARDTPKSVDFGYGDVEYKRMFANHQTVSGPVMLAGRSFRPAAAVAAMRLRRYGGECARSALKRTNLLTRLRKLYRGATLTLTVAVALLGADMADAGAAAACLT